MSSNTTDVLESPRAARSEGGITLLEAYSALAGRGSRQAPAIEIPFPGQPSGADPEGRFWTFTFRNVG